MAGETSGATLLPKALRRLCADGPVVCAIETADLHAGGLWADRVERSARRVATDVDVATWHWLAPLTELIEITAGRAVTASRYGVSGENVAPSRI